MAPTTTQEDALAGFIASLPEDTGTALRSLANAWRSGGGSLAVGHVATRLVGTHKGGAPFTAATLYQVGPRLEVCRVILGHHGVDADAWTDWSDPLLDLASRGFEPSDKYPSIDLADVTPTELARLVTSMRDLARLVTA